MSILAALVRAYDRMPDAPPFGYSLQSIGVVVGLNEDGSVASVTSWTTGEGKKRKPRQELVPQPVKRTAGVSSNFLWDKTSYVLGVTAGEGKRVAEEHAAFKERHEKALADEQDPGLRALLLFLRQWTPDQFVAPDWPDELKDQNVIFVLESERLNNVWLHLRPAAKALWTRVSGEGSGSSQICLVTGEPGPIARLHPSIKGVWGAQSAGASIVSFNLDAFKSYGHEQGDNAPVSEAAASAYTTALNRYLESNSKNRIQIGDASTVFWADSHDLVAAKVAEMAAQAMYVGASEIAAEEAGEDKTQTERVAILLKRLRDGEQMETIAPDLDKGVRFHVLGLSPNAARISIRYYFEDDFGVLANNYGRFVQDMRIEPPPRQPYPPLWAYLGELALLRKRDNVPAKLAGEWLRAIMTGSYYPLTLLATVLSRIRADGEVNALRAGLLRALLVRNFGMQPGNGDKTREAPVELDQGNKSKGYLLGRLFAVYEHAQSAALGRNVNASIKDKFYGSASAAPQAVFALLERGCANHLSKIRKTAGQGRHDFFLITIGSIMEQMSPENDPFPKSLNAKEQALFGLGYYHQRAEFFRKREPGTEGAAQ